MADQPASPVPTPASPLVGRERERAVLRDALDAALAGRGSVVLIGGEAGIGKTALAEALLTEAAGRGALALVGRCYDLSETPPYGPWAEALARPPHDYGLPAPPDLLAGAGATSQAALFAQVRDYLAALAARQPLALLLDDLHWADAASLDLLRALARQLANLPLLLLVTYRADELTRRHPFYRLLPLLVREARAIRLDLRPLGEADFRLIVRQYALPVAEESRLVAYLTARAEGNPFYAGELLRALEEGQALRRVDGGWHLGGLVEGPVPPLLRQVIDARVDHLGEAARELLAVAAVLGPDVPLDLWRELVGDDEDVLLAGTERAVEAGLLLTAGDGSRVRFAHALIREALYEGLLPPRRRRVHRRAGEALAASPHPDPDAVAYHFRQAGDARAAAWLMRAGLRANAAHADVTAFARLEAALPALAGGERAVALLGLAFLRRFEERGIRDAAEALGLARQVGDEVLTAGALIRLGLTRAYRGRPGQALRDVAAANAVMAALHAAASERVYPLLVGPLPVASGDRQRAMVTALAASGRYADTLVALGGSLDAALADLETAHIDTALALFYLCVAWGRPEEALRASESLRGRFRAEEQWAFVAGQANMPIRWVVVPYRTDDPTERRRLVAEWDAALAQDAATSAQIPRWYPWLGTCWPLLLLEGRWDEARRAWSESDAANASGDTSLGANAGLCIGQIAWAQGDPATAWRRVGEAVPGGPAAEPGEADFLAVLPFLRLAAMLALGAGDLPVAHTWLAAHDRWLAWGRAVLGLSEGHALWAQYHRRAGDPGRARAHADQSLAHATEPRQPLDLLAAHRLLGELDTEAGRSAAAASHLAAALALAGACAAPYERALTLLALAELRLVAGDRDDARAALDEARAILAPLAARPALARADALAARLVAEAATRTALPAGLSAREVEVLRLVANGLTNAQVAERLFLSPRTIDQHLRSIYGKLGVDNRTAAAQFATAHGLTGGAP